MTDKRVFARGKEITLAGSRGRVRTRELSRSQASCLPHDDVVCRVDVLESGRSIVEAFQAPEPSRRSFISYAAEISGSSYLQFASLKEIEVFERTDSATVLWGQMALPDVVVRAEAPVEYTYYLDLDEEWKLLIEEQNILVQAHLRFASTRRRSTCPASATK